MNNQNTKRFKVGVRLPDWISGYASRLFEGFLDFQRTGAALHLHFDQPTGGDIPHYPIDEHWEGDGLIVYRYSKAEAIAWKEAGIAVVNLSAEVPYNAPAFPRVTVDNEALGKQGYEHLASLGVRDFAYMHESTRLYSELRLRSFRTAVASGGGRFHLLDVPVSSFPIRRRPAEIHRCLHNQLLSLPRPCGIFLKDDIAGVWTSRLLERLGIRCPDEIALLGISDDIVFCHTTTPPLSSIPYPGRKIGYTAADLLDKIMRGEKFPDGYWRKIAPGIPVIRESSRRVVLTDKFASRALDFIRQEAPSRAVTVAELCRHTGISREGLRLRFLDALGHTPKKEIERIRCQALTRRLRETNDTLDTIAVDHGFPGADGICRYVKRQTGKTPGQIRREI